MPSVKNIGKPCAGKLHARFDEGGQAKACFLLYPVCRPLRGFPALLDWSGFLINSHDPLRGHVLKHIRQNSLTRLCLYLSSCGG